MIRLVAPVTPESPLSIFNLMTPNWTSSVVQPSAFEPVQEVAGRTAMPYTSPPPSTASPPTQAATRPTASNPLPARNETPLPVDAATTTPAPAMTLHWEQGLTLLWLGGLLLLAGYVFALNCWYTWRLRHAAPVEDTALLHVFQDCASQMEAPHVRLCETELLRSPAVMGMWRPRLLLPLSASETLSHRDLRYVFLHELAHVRRWDIPMNWLCTLLLFLHWFNPILWFGFRRMRHDQELACDNEALRHTQPGEAKAYGETIMTMLQKHQKPSPAPGLTGLAGVVEARSSAGRRIRHIAAFRYDGRTWSVLAIAAALLLTLVSLTNAQSNTAASEEAALGASGSEEIAQITHNTAEYAEALDERLAVMLGLWREATTAHDTPTQIINGVIELCQTWQPQGHPELEPIDPDAMREAFMDYLDHIVLVLQSDFLGNPPHPHIRDHFTVHDRNPLETYTAFCILNAVSQPALTDERKASLKSNYLTLFESSLHGIEARIEAAVAPPASTELTRLVAAEGEVVQQELERIIEHSLNNPLSPLFKLPLASDQRDKFITEQAEAALLPTLQSESNAEITEKTQQMMKEHLRRVIHRLPNTLYSHILSDNPYGPAMHVFYFDERIPGLEDSPWQIMYFPRLLEVGRPAPEAQRRTQTTVLKHNPEITPEAQQQAQCANHLKQWGLVMKMFASENRGLFPVLSKSAGYLTPDPRFIFPDYVNILEICHCPAQNPNLDIETDLVGEAAVREHFQSSDYYYLGYVLEDDASVEAFASAYRAAIESGQELPEVLETIEGSGSGHGIRPLREGVERFFITDINDPGPAARAQSEIPVMMDKMGNHPEGGNVLYMDGHVAFVRKGDWPMTERTHTALAALETLRGETLSSVSTPESPASGMGVMDVSSMGSRAADHPEPSYEITTSELAEQLRIELSPEIARELLRRGWWPEEDERLQVRYLVALHQIYGLETYGDLAVETFAELIEAGMPLGETALHIMETLQRIDTPASAALLQALYHKRYRELTNQLIFLDSAGQIPIINELGRMGYSGALAPLRMALHDVDETVRLAAIEAIGMLDTPEAATTLEGLLQTALRDHASGGERHSIDAIATTLLSMNQELNYPLLYEASIQVSTPSYRRHSVAWELVGKVEEDPGSIRDEIFGTRGPRSVKTDWMIKFKAWAEEQPVFDTSNTAPNTEQTD